MDNIEPIIVLTTVPSTKAGESIAKRLVEQRAVACVNILPKMTSIYHWEGQIQKEDEYLLIIKSVKEREKEVYDLIRKLHSYDVPEILTIPIQNGDESYLNWLQSCTNFD